MTAAMLIEPVFKERVWGGEHLREWFGDLVPEGTIGECWGISGMHCNSGIVLTGPASGLTLEEAWQQGFVTGGPREDDLPILVKLLDADDWLSVQVHPNDTQAQRLEDQPRGKQECWYVVSARPDAELILGHDLDSAAELAVAFAGRQLGPHLLRHKVEAGQFFMVPAGCVHSLGPGMVVCEVQQSSDLTYRLYDFGRVGLDGQPRELHIEKGFAVVTAPFRIEDAQTAGPVEPVTGGTRRTLAVSTYFEVSELKVRSEMAVAPGVGTYRLIAVVEGSGELREGGDRIPLRRGSCVVLPVGCGDVSIAGQLTMIVTDPRG